MPSKRTVIGSGQVDYLSWELIEEQWYKSNPDSPVTSYAIEIWSREYQYNGKTCRDRKLPLCAATLTAIAQIFADAAKIRCYPGNTLIAPVPSHPPSDDAKETEELPF